MNGEKYSDMIRHQLKLAIRRKRLCVSSSGVYLQHHNSRLRTARHTLKQIQGLQLEVLPYPPYSPDLAPSDFHLFWPIEDSVCKRRFGSYEEVKEAVHYWLVHQPKDVLYQGICALVERWRSCVERGRGLH